jgi:predicted amidophosphoribosyltransferase
MHARPGSDGSRAAEFFLSGVPAGWACGPYRGTLRRMILQAKQGPQAPSIALLRRELIQAVRSARLPRGHLVAPPASRARRWQGWHLAEELAHGLATSLAWPVLRPFRRARERPPQAGLGAAARRANLHGSYAWRRPWFASAGAERARIQRVYVVDDVLTTGGTFLECARLFAQLGVTDVRPLVLAWVPDACLQPTGSS